MIASDDALKRSAITANTRLIALFGHPVSHSLSPLIHNAAFLAEGLDFRYLAFDVLPQRLGEALAGFRAFGFAGANVTLPHKQVIGSFLDDLTETARGVGSVNTLFWRNDDVPAQLVGHNTDVEGFLAPLTTQEARLKDSSIAVLGCGGAARAVVYAAARFLKPRHLAIIARDTARAEVLKSAFDDALDITVHSFAAATPQIQDASLIVNTTPVGMHPHTSESPWPDGKSFRPGQIVYDLIYNPAETRLLREARAAGADVIGGLEMFIAQAAGSYERWTRQAFPVELARDLLLRHQSEKTNS